MARDVAVIMSTYNGERYLREQLDSLICQSVPVDLYVRDDGSNDETLRILEEYQRENNHIILIEGSNLGCTASFLDALHNVPDYYTYYAFCDQDDVWHSDKIERALLKLESFDDQSVPLLYASEYNYCSEDMKFQSRSHLNKNGVSFSKCLFENICSGNTMVFNLAARQLMLRGDVPSVYCHDWWASLSVSCFGTILFDDEPSLDYRRTGNNVSPSGSKGLALLLFRIKTFIQKGQLRDIRLQLDSFWRVFAEEMEPEKRRLLERVTFGSPIARALTPSRFRQKGLDELVVRCLLMFNLL